MFTGLLLAGAAALQLAAPAAPVSSGTPITIGTNRTAHATIYQQVEAQALQFLLAPAQAAPPEFGFEVQCFPRS